MANNELTSMDGLFKSLYMDKVRELHSNGFSLFRKKSTPCGKKLYTNEYDEYTKVMETKVYIALYGDYRLE